MYVGLLLLVTNHHHSHTIYDGDIMQLRHADEVDVSTPQCQTILDGREEQHAGKSNVDSEYTICRKT